MDEINWLFQAGDTVTAFLPNHPWYRKKIKVKTIEVGSGKLWGTFEGGECLIGVTDIQGLTLLRRPELIFEVWDKIIVLNGKRLNNSLKVGQTGRIIVINPDPRMLYPYLAEFDDFDFGHEGLQNWGCPWFPNEYKDSCHNRLWMSGNSGIEKYIP